MRMKFIGKSSCGFQHGRIYELMDIIQPSIVNKDRLACGMMIWLGDVNSNASCPYSSVAAIMKNWKYVEE